MRMEIRSDASSFRKQWNKADVKIQRAFGKRIKLFKVDRQHPFLRNHALQGNWQGFRSINITGDWRAVFFEKKIRGNLVVTFVALGTHSQLYK